jgi:hypothetical protein
VRPELLSAFVIAMVVAALVSSWSIPSGHDIYRAINPLLERLGFRDQVTDTDSPDTAKNTAGGEAEAPPALVLLGFFREASSLLHELQARLSEASLREILVVDFNPEAHRKLKKLGIRCRYGDVGHPDTLKHLGLENAAIVACTLPDHVLKGTTNLKLLRSLRKILPAGKGRVIVTAETLESAREMYRQGADYVFIPRMVTARYLADVLERLRREEADGVRDAAMDVVGKRVEILP